MGKAVCRVDARICKIASDSWSSFLTATRASSPLFFRQLPDYPDISDLVASSRSKPLAALFN